MARAPCRVGGNGMIVRKCASTGDGLSLIYEESENTSFADPLLVPQRTRSSLRLRRLDPFARPVSVDDFPALCEDIRVGHCLQFQWWLVGSTLVFIDHTPPSPPGPHVDGPAYLVGWDLPGSRTLWRIEFGAVWCHNRLVYTAVMPVENESSVILFSVCPPDDTSALSRQARPTARLVSTITGTVDAEVRNFQLSVGPPVREVPFEREGASYFVAKDSSGATCVRLPAGSSADAARFRGDEAVHLAQFDGSSAGGRVVLSFFVSDDGAHAPLGMEVFRFKEEFSPYIEEPGSGVFPGAVCANLRVPKKMYPCPSFGLGTWWREAFARGPRGAFVYAKFVNQETTIDLFMGKNSPRTTDCVVTSVLFECGRPRAVKLYLQDMRPAGVDLRTLAILPDGHRVPGVWYCKSKDGSLLKLPCGVSEYFRQSMRFLSRARVMSRLLPAGVLGQALWFAADDYPLLTEKARPRLESMASRGEYLCPACHGSVRLRGDVCACPRGEGGAHESQKDWSQDLEKFVEIIFTL